MAINTVQPCAFSEQNLYHVLFFCKTTLTVALTHRLFIHTRIKMDFLFILIQFFLIVMSNIRFVLTFLTDAFCSSAANTQVKTLNDFINTVRYEIEIYSRHIYSTVVTRLVFFSLTFPLRSISLSGSLSDPSDIAGLAHFCEHMLFLGTKKYPKENEYSQFLSEHAGSSNAFTSGEHTNYYFDVSHEHLQGALDR